MTRTFLRTITADRTRQEFTDRHTTREQLIDGDPTLVVPKMITVAPGLDLMHARRLVRVAQGLYTVWDTGLLHHLVGVRHDAEVAHAARATTSVRAAVPDLRCAVEHLAVEAEGFSVRLRFTGHFTGNHRGMRGSGAVLDTTAYDVQLVPPLDVVSASA